MERLKNVISAAVAFLFLCSISHEKPAPTDLPRLFNKATQTWPNETCTSQNNKCLAVCKARTSADEQKSCNEDCAWPVTYCKTETGLYPWIRSKSVWVGQRE